MAITKIGTNLSALKDITAPNITIATDPTEILTQLPTTANSVTNDLLAFGIMLVLALILFWILADKSPFADFGYSDARAGAIAMVLATNVGIMMLMIGWVADLKAVGFFQILGLVWMIFIEIYENKE